MLNCASGARYGPLTETLCDTLAAPIRDTMPAIDAAHLACSPSKRPASSRGTAEVKVVQRAGVRAAVLV